MYLLHLINNLLLCNAYCKHFFNGETQKKYNNDNKGTKRNNTNTTICSKHFQTDYYILPPSSGTTCRLKNMQNHQYWIRLPSLSQYQMRYNKADWKIETRDPFQQNQKFYHHQKKLPK